MWMIEAGENLALAPETLQQVFAVRAGLNDLDGDSLAELGIIAFGQVNHAHAAAPDLAQKAIRAERLTC